LVFLATIVEKDNNGRLSILTKQMDHKLRDWTKSGASMSTDLSTLFLSYHSRE
jgi:hypothetical protein